MRRHFVLICLAITAMSAPAVAQEDSFMFGAGLESCATWLSNPIAQADGNAWIWGFWSGMNYVSKFPSVGHTTDAKGIVALIKQECQSDPSRDLQDVVAATYLDFVKQGR